MREAVIILAVFAVLAVLTAIRYRKQIATVLKIWQMLRSARQMKKPGENRIDDVPVSAGPLVSCPKCGTWIPQTKAIKLGRASYYCSAECLEKTAKTT